MGKNDIKTDMEGIRDEKNKKIGGKIKKSEVRWCGKNKKFAWEK